MRATSVVFCVGLIALIAPLGRAEYKLVWADEFNDAELNSANWTAEHYHGVVRGARDAGHYTVRPANIRVVDGVLELAAQRESFELANFTSARIQTYGKFAFTHGRVAVRMKITHAAGLRPQVSLLPVDLAYGAPPASGAIDLLDADAGRPLAGLHFGDSGPRGAHTARPFSTPESDPTWSEFHVYTLEWQPNEIRWYLDERLVAMEHQWSSAAAPHPAPFDRPFFLAVGLAVEEPGAQQIESWPQTLQIDWIRVERVEGNHAPRVELTAPRANLAVPAGKALTLQARAADPDGDLAAVEFYADEILLSSDRDAPFEFAWNPPDGCYAVVARAVDVHGFAAAAGVEITVGRGCPPTPYHGVPAAIPGRIEAEDFDASRKGDACFDVDASNNGGAYRPNSAVDIQPCSGGGFNLCWMIDHEWTRYTVNVREAGRYDLRCRAASPHDTAQIRIELDGENITGSLRIPNTHDWQRYTDIWSRGIELEAGEHVLRVVTEREGLNLDFIEFLSPDQ